MPADRSDTGASPEASTSSGKPYVRSEEAHAARRANVMPRGAACLSCKSRKVRRTWAQPV